MRIAHSVHAFSRFWRPEGAGAGVEQCEGGRAGAPEATRWMDWTEACAGPEGTALAELVAWFESYVMQPHPDLGRSGHVCPYMAKATRLNLVRFHVSALPASDEAAILTLLKDAQDLFAALPCEPKDRRFRSVVVAFPACASDRDTATLKRLQHALTLRSARMNCMLGLFEPYSEQAGICNRAFLSFRSAIPLLAVRSLVEPDAPFVIRNPAMVPRYVAQFGARPILHAVQARLAERLSPIFGRT